MRKVLLCVLFLFTSANTGLSAPWDSLGLSAMSVYLTGGGQWPHSIKTADFDHDGIIEVVVAEWNTPHQISIFENDGLGSLAFSTSYPTPPNPYDLVVADMNSDSYDDIVVSSPSGYLAVYLNDRTGAFTQFSNEFIGGTVEDLAWGLLNDDMSPDVIIMRELTGYCQIRFGDGTGGFIGDTLLYGVSQITDAASVDLDSDGDQDLVVTERWVSQIESFFNDGNGHFARGTTATVGSGAYDTPYRLAVGDFNEDSYVDVATANYYDVAGSMSVLLGTPGYGWGPPAVVYSFGGFQGIEIQAIDLNLDQCADLVCSYGEYTEGGVAVFVGKCDGTFVLKADMAYDRCGVFVADLDGDNKQDILSNGFQDATFATWLNITGPQLAVSVITFPEESNGEHIVDHTPLLTWILNDSLATQDSAILQIGDDTNWSAAEQWDTTIAGPNKNLAYNGTLLMDGQSYYMRLRAHAGSFWSDWVDTAFRMNTTPEPAVQISPIDFAEVDTTTPTFRAVVQPDAEGDSQQVQFAIYIDDSILIEESPLVPVSYVQAGDTVEWTPTVPLNENWFYFWITRTWDGYEYSAWNWGGMESFVVNAQNEAPQAPSLYIPQGDAIVWTQHPSFAWTPVSDIDPYDTVVYDFRVSIDSLFAFALDVDGLSDTEYTAVTPLEIGRRYWWKVVSRDNHGLTAESEVAQFRTYKPGDVAVFPSGSWTVNTADIITLVNHVFKSVPVQVPACTGDVNGMPSVTAADIIYLVNYVFRSGAAPMPGCG
jgi:hypothetical protein